VRNFHDLATVANAAELTCGPLIGTSPLCRFVCPIERDHAILNAFVASVETI